MCAGCAGLISARSRRNPYHLRHMRELTPMRPAWPIYLTAFVEGLIVIVVEIAGARALAPFYGTSLQVWTAQITMTLFFLALGYGVGGLIAQSVRSSTVPALFGIAGAW